MKDNKTTPLIKTLAREVTKDEMQAVSGAGTIDGSRHRKLPLPPRPRSPRKPIAATSPKVSTRSS